MNTLATAECYPITVVSGLSPLYLDFCAGAPAVRDFYGRTFGEAWRSERPRRPEHWPRLVSILGEQNPGASAARQLEALRGGAGTVLTGQQVSFFGGPLFTPFKAATALARARQATAAGDEHVGIFWLASEDHDFAEVQSVTFPARREVRTLKYEKAPTAAVPVGGIVLDESVNALLDQAGQLVGYSDALEALTEAYKPGRTFAQAFADFYRKVFAAQGLLMFDAAGRDVHALGAPVLLAAIEGADEMHAALTARGRALEAAGYHEQVAVAPNSSLLFLLDARTGARVALKRVAASAAEPNGLWQAGREKISTEELTGILAAEPERISPSALLRPVFQDYLFATSLTIGGPAEVAYFAQSAVLFELILTRMTPLHPRFTATIVEPDIAELLRRHELSLERVFEETIHPTNKDPSVGTPAPDSMAQLLAARSMPAEGKRRLAAAGTALDTELTEVVGWMNRLNADLGRSGETAASKMRYQMNRLRRLGANFVLQREESLKRHAQAICAAVFPGGKQQERVHGAAWYFARHGFEFAEELVEHAAKDCPGHSALWV